MNTNASRRRFARLLTALALAIPLCACALQLPPIADTYISTKNSERNNNFGSQSNMQVGNGATALIKFNAAALPAGTTGNDVKQATLLLWVNSAAHAGALNAASVTTAWTEGTVTQNTAPTLSASPFATANLTTSTRYVSLDATALVKQWIDTPASDNGLALFAPAGSLAEATLFTIDSGSTASASATLDVTLNALPGATGPQGPAGPVGATGATGPTGACSRPANGQRSR